LADCFVALRSVRNDGRDGRFPRYDGKDGRSVRNDVTNPQTNPSIQD